MHRILLITNRQANLQDIIPGLTAEGFACSSIQYTELTPKAIISHSPDLIILAFGKSTGDAPLDFLKKREGIQKQFPVIALINTDLLNDLVELPYIDDFAIHPWNTPEIAARAKRLLSHRKAMDNRNAIICDNLIIDSENCEVTLDGQRIALTFKEYELLKHLASNRGRVFTRESLLNEVWGYDYFGGYRTVDVHIRRLRGKIEDANHTFIETVRNIGYRFIKNS